MFYKVILLPYFIKVVFLEFTDAQNIAIDVPRKTIIHGEEDLVVACSLLRYNALLKVEYIQLFKNTSQGQEELLATVSDEVQSPFTRSGVRISGSLRPLWSANLNFTIAREFVDCLGDSAGYVCSLKATDQLFKPVQQLTEAVPVYIAVKCSTGEATVCKFYNQTNTNVVVIGITVAILIVVIGAGVNFAIWRKYHSVLNRHIDHTERRQSQLEEEAQRQDLDSSLKGERPHYTELNGTDKQETYDVLHPYLEPISSRDSSYHYVNNKLK
ncbi:uncharacterized protein LOC133204985 [Saccostrea echinata]|uniref:uncharacterized protein LOC133204985 n=1 Tax=Saccostrea echinata TaxID=191078 RepID=UPI002A810031|nr:uncharacterized protein LOC133204985 [Saccostrea echinata]